MKLDNDYSYYLANKPTKDAYYLVLVKHALILKLGLAPSPDALIARYDSATQEWTAVLGGTSQGLGDIGKEIICWRDLPLP